MARRRARRRESRGGVGRSSAATHALAVCSFPRPASPARSPCLSFLSFSLFFFFLSFFLSFLCDMERARFSLNTNLPASVAPCVTHHASCSLTHVVP